MRGGKSIWIIIGGLLATAFLWPTWEWWYQSQLSHLSSEGRGPTGFMAGVLAVMSPIQQLLYGVAFGMMIAYFIGYRGYLMKLAAFVRPLLAASNPMPHIVFSGTLELGGDAQRGSTEYPKEISVSHVLQDKTGFVYHQAKNGNLEFTRLSSESRQPLKITFSVWGRWRFWPSLKMALAGEESLARMQGTMDACTAQSRS